jgi:GT2 family glycosyltransferase
VDNASQDGSVEMVGNMFPQATLIRNEENVGFARGNNQAIRQSAAPFVLLLNADTEVLPGAFEALVRFMKAHPGAGAAGPRIDNADRTLQTSCYPLPTLARESWRMFHLDRIRPFGVYDMSGWDKSRPRRVDVVLGACMLLRREALDQVGLLDESYFMYGEEPDLAFRLKRDSWEVHWVPEAHIIHFGGQSTRQVEHEMFLQLYRSKVLFFEKHHGAVSAFAYRAILVLASIVRLLISPVAWLLRPADRADVKLQVRSYGRLIRVLVSGLLF